MIRTRADLKTDNNKSLKNSTSSGNQCSLDGDLLFFVYIYKDGAISINKPLKKNPDYFY